jgi:glycine cleavage system aminomethyltransferase T
MTGFSLSGPNARKVLEKLTHQDVSNAGFPIFACRALDVGLLRVRAARLSISGELGYELNCPAVEHAALRRILLEAGREFGIAEIGFNAVLSLRLEKSFGIWSREFTPLCPAGHLPLKGGDRQEVRSRLEQVPNAESCTPDQGGSHLDDAPSDLPP